MIREAPFLALSTFIVTSLANAGQTQYIAEQGTVGNARLKDAER